MKYNFDKVIDRRNTASEKYCFLKEQGLPEDTLPMWVADMDFETVPEVKERLKSWRITAYTDIPEEQRIITAR